MPEYLFGGLVPYHYPATRDARGVHLGMVEPDDIRDLDSAPDRMWREPTAEDRERIAAKAADAGSEQDESRVDEDSGDTGEDNDPPPPPASTHGPVPAPPAVIPPAA